MTGIEEGTVAINTDDLLAAYTAEIPAERRAALQRLIEAAYIRGWADCEKANGYVPRDLADPVRRHILEQEIELGML